MAKPIKITPVLRGNDATNFLNSIKENSTKMVSKETLVNIREQATKLKSIFRTR
ncbi:hypothetical protein SAMN04488023_1334 [Pedobacter rhizosphaerae]|uniref:Uncharacterized protein n=1 Tax=Pedobacter rhizosphaerae TaxID=390241 RepID=A0A1H9UQG0_9SPHI|nr:hypothetical protein SAMN04488023_1334 [Pedobacter rhizosphaerae]